jgi:hypothetical protein
MQNSPVGPMGSISKFAVSPEVAQSYPQLKEILMWLRTQLPRYSTTGLQTRLVNHVPLPKGMEHLQDSAIVEGRFNPIGDSIKVGKRLGPESFWKDRQLGDILKVLFHEQKHRVDFNRRSQQKGFTDTLERNKKLNRLPYDKNPDEINAKNAEQYMMNWLRKMGIIDEWDRFTGKLPPKRIF